MAEFNLSNLARLHNLETGDTLTSGLEVRDTAITSMHAVRNPSTRAWYIFKVAFVSYSLGSRLLDAEYNVLFHDNHTRNLSYAVQTQTLKFTKDMTTIFIWSILPIPEQDVLS